ncbi:MAG: AraC family transcriptional regulator [Pseudomonadota bacterium]
MPRTIPVLPALSPDHVAATPMAFARGIVWAYARYGADPGPALRQAQITPRQLAQPLGRITATQFELLSAWAMQELDDEALGWFSRRLHWGSYGLLIRASITAPTLGVALKRWCRHHRLLTDDVLLHLEVDRDHAHVWIEERRPLGEQHEFCLATLLRYLHGFACWAIDSRIPLQQTTLPFAAPGHAGVYPLLFPGPVAFDAATAGYRFDAQYLALPPLRDEAATRAMLQRALPLTVRQYRRDRLVVARVRELLRTSPAAPHTAEAVATHLHLSVRTLHRQLHEEGAALQALKDEVRRTQAMALLKGSRKPLKQVALAVGFRNEKSFARAFRGWTGESPGRWRQ